MPEDPNALVIAGIFRTPEEFTAEALKLVHPSDLQAGVPEEILHAIYDLFSLSPADHMASMAKASKGILKAAKDLQASNRDLLNSCHPSVAKILQGKSRALAQHLID